MTYLNKINPEGIDSIPEVRQQLRLLKKAIDKGEIADDSKISAIVNDKSYVASDFSGLGRKNLEKNIVKIGGVDKNILTQSDFNKSNTIYVIQYDYDLNDPNGENPITIPEGCILKFDGGSLSNGNIVFNSTLLDGDIKMSSVNASGFISNEYVSPRWFGAKGDGVTNDSKAFKCACNVCNDIRVDDGDYVVNNPKCNEIESDGIFLLRSHMRFTMSKGCTLHAANDIPDDETGNTIRAIITIQGEFTNYYYDVVKIEDIIVSGGRIVGPRQYFTLPEDSELPDNNTKENNIGVFIRYADNVSVNDCIMSDMLGDGVFNYGCEKTAVNNCIISRCRRAGINFGSGGYAQVLGCEFFENGVYVTYQNGNSSYGFSYSHCIGFEPEYYGRMNNVKIHSALIKNNVFDIGEMTYGILGRCIGMEISNNIFKNIKPGSKFAINMFAQNDDTFPSYSFQSKDINILYNEFITDSASDWSEVNWGSEHIHLEASGNNFIQGNKVTEKAIANLAGGNFSINNNVSTGASVFLIFSINNGVSKVEVTDNTCDATEFIVNTPSNISSVNGSSLFCANNNVKGSVKTRPSTFDALMKNIGIYDTCLICGNDFTIDKTYIFDKKISDTGECTIINNTFNILGSLRRLFGYSSGVFVCKADVLYNKFYGTENHPLAQLVETNFTAGHANIIGNVYKDYSYKGLTVEGYSTSKVTYIDNIRLGSPAANPNGEFTDKPTLTSDNKGFVYFDITNSRPIWWNGTAWVDASGTEV